MNESQFLNHYSIILTILTFAITVLSGYVGYLSVNLKKRIKSEILDDIDQAINKTEDNLQLRVWIIDKIINSAISTINENIKEPSDSRNQLYALSHLIRLTSKDEEDQIKSLNAFEQLGKSVYYLIPYIERIRNNSSWSVNVEQHYKKFLETIENRAIT